MKRLILSATIGIALGAATPLAAQDDASGEEAAMAELDTMMGTLAEAFPAEPLTPEEEARLPQAQRIVALIIPEGTMAEIMGQMIDDIVKPMMAMSGSGAKLAVAKGLGVTPFELDITEEKAAELAVLFDPAWKERQKREFDVFPSVMRDMMVLMEPGLRTAMSQAYAARFTSEELTDIEAFFSTSTGRKYARESFAMASDPRMMGASMEALPAMMGAMGDMEARMAEAVADLGEVRGFDDLSDAGRAQVVEATGFTEEEIRAGLGMGDPAEGDDWAEEAAQEAESF